MSLSRILEEICPFPYYLARAGRQRQRTESPYILKEPGYTEYGSLPAEQLMERLKEERARAVALDDKTFKLTLSLTVGLTVLGSTAAVLVRAVSAPTMQATLTFIIGVALLYILSAGFVAIGSLRTLPSFGYGTAFLLQQKAGASDAIADALVRQEIMNSIRHLRNETAYQAMRNGLILLFTGILLFAVTLAYQSLYPGQLAA